MNVNSMTEKLKASQSGVAAVEFALVAIVFFTLLLGIIEFGRFLYVRNTVQEVTRAAAREAVVSRFTASQIVNIRKDAVFHSGASGNPALPGSNEITSSEINIHYMSSPTTEIPSGAMPSSPEDNIAACLDATRTDSCIRFVQAEVCAENELPCTHPVLYQPMVGLFSFLHIAIPASSVIMPAESMGYSQ
ncbi:MAG: TadE/TadG family type IV pilus assembly protein [Sulfuriferula sp.]|nr:TadE/TadG family type IV pilus assembly protein [Sulfuriferula sp.]